jgi:hypothetical protein
MLYKLIVTSIEIVVYTHTHTHAEKERERERGQTCTAWVKCFYAITFRRLDVSHNGITEMEEDVLQSVRHLDYLNISFNNLKEFQPRTFAGLVKVPVL